MIEHVVMFSGGVSSWATSKRVVTTTGTSNFRMVFADTLMEDEDLYRFNIDAADNVIPCLDEYQRRELYELCSMIPPIESADLSIRKAVIA